MYHSDPFHILHDVPVGIFILNRDFTIAFWNRCMAQWSRLTEEDVLNRDIRSIYPELKKKKHALRIENVFNGGPPVLLSAQLHGTIFPCKKNSGTHRIFNTRIKSLRVPHSPPPPADRTVTTTQKKEHHFEQKRSRQRPHPLQAIFTLEDVTDLSERIQTYYQYLRQIFSADA